MPVIYDIILEQIEVLFFDEEIDDYDRIPCQKSCRIERFFLYSPILRNYMPAPLQGKSWESDFDIPAAI